MKKVVRFSVHHPWWVIGIVLCITGYFLVQVPRVKIDPRVEIVLRQNNPVEEVYNRNKQEFESYADILIGMLHTDIYNPGSLEKIRKITREVEDLEGVKKVTSILNVKNITGNEGGLEVNHLAEEGEPPSSPEDLRELRERAESWEVYEGVYIAADGTGTSLSVVLDDSVETDDIVPIYYILLDIMEKYEGPEEFFISGPTVVEALQGHYMIKDLKLLVPLVNIVLLGFLFLFFRNFRGMVLPLLAVGIGSTWTIGLMPLIDIPLTMVTSVLPVALIAVGSAYGIHVLENVFSDAEEGKTGSSGITASVTRVSLPVIMAGLTTIASFMSLCTSAIVPLKQFGALSGFGLFVAVVISLTFVPAVLSVVDSVGWKYKLYHHSNKDHIGPVLRFFSRISLTRSRLILGASLVLFVLSVGGGLLVKSDLNLIEDFREGSPIRVADEILNDKFGGTSLFNVVLDGTEPDDIKDPSVLREMDALQDRLMGMKDIGKAVSVVDFIKRMNQAMHDGDPAHYTRPESQELVAQYLLLFSFSGGSGELDSFVNFDYSSGQILLQMKSQSGYLAQDVVDVVDGYQKHDLDSPRIAGIFTTGLSMLAKEFNRLVVQSQARSFTVSFILVILIVSVMFKSFKLGCYSVIPLVVPIVLNFGIMGVTGIKLNAATAIIASLAIGIGIDYSIHFLSRYRHEVRMHDSVDNAIETSLNTSGRAILYNALAVAAGFMVLVPSNFVIISQLGILVALVMITTSLASITLLPAILKTFPPRLAVERPRALAPVLPLRTLTPGVQTGEENVVGYTGKAVNTQSNRRMEHEM